MESKSFILLFYFAILFEISLCYHLSSSPVPTIFSMESLCTSDSSKTINFTSSGINSYGVVTAQMPNNSLSNSLPVNFNCTLILNAPKGYKLHLGFSQLFSLNRKNDQLNVSTSNSKTIHEFSEYRSCPSENCLDLEFDATTIELRFKMSNNESLPALYRGFLGMVTVYSSADSHGNCHTTEQFRCHNRHCIWKGLYCNRHNHCGDLSDEPQGCKPFAEQAIWGILVIVFGFVSFCIFLPLFCYFAIRGQRRRMKITRSAYQPLPTSINDRQTGNSFSAILVGPYSGNIPKYGTNNDSSSSTEVPVHQKYSNNEPYQ